MPEIITSKSNRYVKLTRSLREKKYREREGLFIAEGLRLAEEAAHEPQQVAYALFSASALTTARGGALAHRLLENGCSVYQLPDEILSYCADTVQAQGVILVCRMPGSEQQRAALLQGACDFFLIADGVQDPGNLGSLLRSAWAAGCNGVILPPGSVDLYNPKVVRSSMGAVFQLPIYMAADNEEALALIREAALHLLVTAADGTSVYQGVSLERPLAFVLGSEARGVSDFWRQAADALVSLPMVGGAESLNVAMAGTIFFYETLRQRLAAK